MRTVFLQIGNRKIKTDLHTTEKGGVRRIEAKFPYAPDMIAEIKGTFDDRRWDPDNKCWHFADSHHNHFRLELLQGGNPYAPYDRPLVEVSSTRGLFKHQLLMKSYGVTRKQCIWAAEPGTGKSLALIELAEHMMAQPPKMDKHNCPYERRYFWVAPKAALFSVQLEAMRWQTRVPFEFMTYDRMKAVIASWPKDTPAPEFVGFDEASRLKNPKAERTKSARYLADMMRDEYGREDCYITLMSGTPAPQSPLDWFSLMQIAVPGYLKEGSWYSFRDNLCLVKEEESSRGGSFPKIITWYDNEQKCKMCGQLPEDILHTAARHPDFHLFQACKNEVARLYNRMNGAVVVVKKKDCLDLPQKIFKRMQAVVPQAMVRAAKMITKTVGTGAKALSLLRELSDGFQYQEYESGEQQCDLCDGKTTINDMVYIGPDPTDAFMESLGLLPQVDVLDPVKYPDYYSLQHVKCCKCDGTGKIPRMAREPKYVGSPKDALLSDLLEEYEDHGRLVVYAAFQASVDRVVQLATAANWDWIKADGRSWQSSMGGNPVSWLADFQNPNSLTKRLVFIGQPEAAGMGLTLTRACATVFYSNSFNGESRLQAVERIDRPGASHELGITIIDLIGLPTDGYVLDKLAVKENLQAITMGSLEKCLDTALVED